MQQQLTLLKKQLSDQLLVHSNRRSWFILALVLLFVAVKSRKRTRKRHNKKAWDYKKLRAMIKDNHLSVPSMFIDLDVFESNVKMMASVAKQNNKTLRIATKSIRCPHLIHHAMKVANGTFKGLMCFSVQEANALVEYASSTMEEHKQRDEKDNDCFDLRSAFNDILIAYPTVSESDIETAYKLTQKGVDISLMIDCVQHIRIIDSICNRIYCNSSPDRSDSSNSGLCKVAVCIDLDLSYRIKCIGLCIGPRRSTIYDEYDLNCILDAILQSKFIKLSGAMGYEAQVAGVMDDTPYSSNWMVRRMKPVLQSDCNERRRSMVQFIRNKIHLINEEGHDDASFVTENNLNSFRFVNGGGTGNLKDAANDSTCTEVSAGSGLIQSKIFDYYLNHQCRPAAAFALQITRISVDEGYINCQSGGFIASGSPSKDREPVPFLPRKQIYGPFDDIGYGEVNTPLRVRDASEFRYGDPVFFRPAKAGEIAERFNEYVLKRGDAHCATVKTYRGLGFAFY